jgi:RNA recognition motif-containing protein
MNIYIFNLNSSISDPELRELFMPFGTVKSAQIVMDVISGESRGFGYVEMEDDVAAQKAIDQLNETELQTLTIFVEEERPKVVQEKSGKTGFASDAKLLFGVN